MRIISPAEKMNYQYMVPGVLNCDELEYVQEHLRILSGFSASCGPSTA